MNELFFKVHEHLPVFAVDCREYTVLYTPGSYLKIRNTPPHEIIESLKSPGIIEDSVFRTTLIGILKSAEKVSAEWGNQKKEDFYPECLTIHVGSDCNLNCSYCYSRIGGEGNKILFGFPDSESIKILFRYILAQRVNKPGVITVVFHGSGEPTFHWDKLVSSLHDISELARSAGQKIFRYIATNGCLEEWQIDWLAESMDLIGISCDGPQTIVQDQRSNQGKKFMPIEKVCERIVRKSCKFEIRTTVTPETISDLCGITAYLVKECRAKTIRIEPVFLAGDKGFAEKDADNFFSLYIKAQEYAEIHGTNLSYAGVRMDELHGTFCDVLRNTLRLTIDDSSRNCFWFMSDYTDFITGSVIGDKSSFSLNSGIREIKKKAGYIPENCLDCINIYHCSRGCPDYCVFPKSISGTTLNPFRCRFHQLLAVERIVKITRDQKMLGTN